MEGPCTIFQVKTQKTIFVAVFHLDFILMNASHHFDWVKPYFDALIWHSRALKKFIFIRFFWNWSLLVCSKDIGLPISNLHPHIWKNICVDEKNQVQDLACIISKILLSIKAAWSMHFVYTRANKIKTKTKIKNDQLVEGDVSDYYFFNHMTFHRQPFLDTKSWFSSLT
jgi:hypothetical protein